MARRISRKEMKRDEFVETAVEASNWLDQNKQAVIKGAVAVVFLGALIGLVFWFLGQGRDRAEAQLSRGIEQYRQAEQAGFDDAAELDAALTLFEEAADQTAGGAAGRSARYYRAATLYRLGRVDEAIELLEALSEENLTPTLASSTSMLLVEVLVDSDQDDRAEELLESIADDPDSVFPPDQVLLRLAALSRERGDSERAGQVLRRIVDDFPQSAGAMEANRLLLEP